MKFLCFAVTILYMGASYLAIGLARELETEKQKNKIVKPEDYAKWLTDMPSSHFRNNMLIVFRAEFEKDSRLLFSILESYNEMKNEENEENEEMQK